MIVLKKLSKPNLHFHRHVLDDHGAILLSNQCRSTMISYISQTKPQIRKTNKNKRKAKSLLNLSTAKYINKTQKSLSNKY